ncbi:uncharacterized protein LOC131143924 [Malania oleifera]|uniref:uncharacterized protein LOC131143924 n=1 Tax=Malania oleifera TaxID=397392 RepID=UPI0025ADE4CD|nr:uncharacterized protein LOC131143924 [Malania oleifera]
MMKSGVCLMVLLLLAVVVAEARNYNVISHGIRLGAAETVPALVKEDIARKLMEKHDGERVRLKDSDNQEKRTVPSGPDPKHHSSSMVETTANTSNAEASSSLQDSYNIGGPLFLHPSENPGVVLTSQPLIGEENYPGWARSVKKSLISKNKLGFIDGSLTISSPLVNSPNAIQAWVCADNMVSTWIINSVSPKLQGSIIYRDTALEIWIDLRDTFSQGNGTKIFNIQKQIAEIHQGEMSLTEYFTQLKILWDQL